MFHESFQNCFMDFLKISPRIVSEHPSCIDSEITLKKSTKTFISETPPNPRKFSNVSFNLLEMSSGFFSMISTVILAWFVLAILSEIPSVSSSGVNREITLRNSFRNLPGSSSIPSKLL